METIKALNNEDIYIITTDIIMGTIARLITLKVDFRARALRGNVVQLSTGDYIIISQKNIVTFDKNSFIPQSIVSLIN